MNIAVSAKREKRKVSLVLRTCLGTGKKTMKHDSNGDTSFIGAQDTVTKGLVQGLKNPSADAGVKNSQMSKIIIIIIIIIICLHTVTRILIPCESFLNRKYLYLKSGHLWWCNG